MITVSLIGCMLFGHAATDSSLFWITPPKPYALQTLFFSLASAGTGICAIVCNNRSNEYYDKYKTETTFGRAFNYLLKAKHNEDMRTLFSICAGTLFLHAVYFEVKHLKARRRSGSGPKMDFQYQGERVCLSVGYDF